MKKWEKGKDWPATNELEGHAGFTTTLPGKPAVAPVRSGGQTIRFNARGKPPSTRVCQLSSYPMDSSGYGSRRLVTQQVKALQNFRQDSAGSARL